MDFINKRESVRMVDFQKIQKKLNFRDVKVHENDGIKTYNGIIIILNIFKY